MDILTDYKFWFASVAVFLTLYAYIPYIKGIFRGETKPHFFTWIVWSIVTFIAVFIQVVEGGEMGSWPTIVAALTCFFITGLAVKYGSKDIKRIDYFFLFSSLCAVPLWIVTKDPTYSAILVTAIEIVAAFPTIRKSWHDPASEVTSTYCLNTIRYILSIFALGAFTIPTLAYPAGMVLMNGLIFAVLFIRRT